MNPLKFSVIIATGALLAFAPRVHAQGDDVPKKINIQLLLRAQQDFETGNDAISKSKIVSTRFNTRDILQTLGTALSNDFTGASLVLIHDNVEVRKGTNVLADVTSFFTVETGDQITGGTSNADNGKSNVKTIQTQQISFDDGAGHSFTLSGLMTIIRSVSAVNNQGEQQFTEEQSMTGSGTGVIEGQFVIVTGTITLKAKGKTEGPF